MITSEQILSEAKQGHRIFFILFHTLCAEVIILDKNYHIADIPDTCIAEINELQEKLKEEINENIVLVAYQAADK